MERHIHSPESPRWKVAQISSAHLLLATYLHESLRNAVQPCAQLQFSPYGRKEPILFYS